MDSYICIYLTFASVLGIFSRYSNKRINSKATISLICHWGLYQIFDWRFSMILLLKHQWGKAHLLSLHIPRKKIWYTFFKTSSFTYEKNIYMQHFMYKMFCACITYAQSICFNFSSVQYFKFKQISPRHNVLSTTFFCILIDARLQRSIANEKGNHKPKCILFTPH